MRRILFDENVPEGVRRLLAGYVVETAAELGLAGLANGDLIEAAENGGFEVMVTADQNLRYQQNLAGRRLALVVLTTNHWDMIRPHGNRVVAAIEEIQAGGYVTVVFDRPPRLRRPPRLPTAR